MARLHVLTNVQRMIEEAGGKVMRHSDRVIGLERGKLNSLTNTEIVVKAVNHLGGSVNRNKAPISAISQMFTMSEVAAIQLAKLAIADRVLVMDSIGEIRKGPAF